MSYKTRNLLYFDSKLREYFLIPVKLQIIEYVVGQNEIQGMGLTAGKIMQKKRLVKVKISQ